jgi:hypothetical protein
MKNAFTRIVAVYAAFAGITTARAATTYEVGTDAGYLSKLSDVPWSGLQPGDIVNIHFKPGGYHEIIQVSAAGTAAQPILIRGVPDPVTGALPVLDGNGAIMDPHVDFRNPVFENFGVIIVTPRAKNYVYGVTFPSWITIESLDIRNALYSAQGNISFTDQHGAFRTFDHFACGIYIEFAQHLTVRGCEISFNGNGIFANSKNGASQNSADLLIEKNYLHDNGQPAIPGLTNGYAEHNIYVESDGAVYQYNRFGPLRAGCHGTMIKDRSAGTVIRYNEVVSTQCSDIFAILDPQGGSGYLNLRPNYPDAYVYGNTITLLAAGGGMANIVWFGAFNGAAYYPTHHRGTLSFYNNTVVNHNPVTAAFSLTDLAYTPTPDIFETVDCRNNIFYTDSATQANPWYAFKMVITGANGTVNMATNWISPGTTPLWLGHEGGSTVNGWNNQLVGDFNGQNNPGFVDLLGLDFNLAAGANSIDAAGPLAPPALALGYDLTEQYVPHQGHVPRPVRGNASDLGAFESSATAPPVTPGNHVPVALPQNIAMMPGATQAITLTGTDVDNDPLTFAIVMPPARGTLSGVAPNLIFTQNGTTGGSDTFAFMVSDGKSTSARGYIFIAYNGPSNPPPLVTFTSPTNNASLTAPGSVTLTATASDANGIAKVDFFAGTTLVNSDSTAPYTFTWTGVPAGTYNIVAKAFDTLGARTYSTPVVVTVH